VVWALVLAAAVTAASLLLLAPRFGVNDDLSMASVADGSYFGEPRPHLVFSNILLGLLLSSLYGWVGAVPWYGVYLTAVHCAALAVVVYLVLSADGSRRSRLPGLAAFVGLFGLWLATNLGFTSQGLMLAVAGVVLYLARGQRRSAVVVAALMAGASTLLRWDSLLGALALALPFLIWAGWRLPRWNQALFAGIVAAVVVFGVVFQKAYYAGDDAWREYSSFNRARGSVMERHSWQRDDALLGEIGWSRNDAAMFASHFYLEAEVFSAADMEVLAGRVIEPRALDTALRGAWRVHTDTAVEVAGWALVGALAVAAALSGGRRARLLAAAVPTWTLGVTVVLVMFRKLPDRVGVPLLAFAALMLLIRPLVPPADAEPPPRHGVRWAAAAACALLTVGLAVTGVALAAAGTGERRAADRWITRVLEGFTALDPEGVFVSWGAQLHFAARSPWHAPLLDGPRLLPLGWQQRSPLEAEWLQSLGIDDAYTAVAAGDGVYLPIGPERSADIYLDFLREHYNFSGILKPTAQLTPFVVYEGVFAYRLTGGLLTETSFDGAEAVYPLDAAGMEGHAGAEVLPDGTTVVTGRAVARDGGAPADLIVVLAGRRGVAVALPQAEAGAWGEPGTFTVTLDRDYQNLTVIALVGSAGSVIALDAAPEG
jgi:hypothetical protein